MKCPIRAHFLVCFSKLLGAKEKFLQAAVVPITQIIRLGSQINLLKTEVNVRILCSCLDIDTENLSDQRSAQKVLQPRHSHAL
jgi:hypothetical protein